MCLLLFDSERECSALPMAYPQRRENLRHLPTGGVTLRALEDKKSLYVLLETKTFISLSLL